MAAFSAPFAVASWTTEGTHLQSRPLSPCLQARLAVTGSKILGWSSAQRLTQTCRRASVKASSNSSSSGSSLRTDSTISLGTAVIPADVDLAVLESVLYKWANSITQSSNLPLPFAARVDKIPAGFRISSMVMSTNGSLESEVDIIVTVSPAQGTEPPMFRAIREGRETAPDWEPGLMKAMLTTLLEGVKIAKKA